MFSIIAIVLSFWTHSAYGAENRKTGPPASQPAGVRSSKKSAKRGDWSFFYEMFKRSSRKSDIKFEVGTAFYSASYKDWRYSRVEPFVKLRWAIIDKYLQLYTIISLDYSSVDYELSHFKTNGMDVSLNANLKSEGTYTFGGGTQILLLGWRKFNMHFYGQMQSTSRSDASLKSAMLTIDKKDYDIFKKVKDYVDITYSFRRYDMGAILSYRFFNWFTVAATAGYISIKADINIILKPDLENAIGRETGIYNKHLIPNRLAIDENSAFGMLALKFRIYKSLHLNLEGTVLSAQYPVYYGMTSISFE